MQNTVAHNEWYLYILRTNSGALYTGITTDVTRRMHQHQHGRGAKALRGKSPLTLVYHCAMSREQAARLEYQVKQLGKKQKERLVKDQPLCLRQWLTDNGRPTSSGKSGLHAQNAPASAVTAPCPSD